MRTCLLAAALLGFGCRGSKSEPTSQDKPDAAAHAVVAAAPPIGAAVKACDTLSKCGDGGVLYVSERECVKQLSARFQESDVNADCYECLAEVTCAGWRAMADGTTDECGVCSGCCASEACDAGESSMPGSSTDPCPQDDPVCPGDAYDAIASCGPDGTWTKRNGSIECRCVRR